MKKILPLILVFTLMLSLFAGCVPEDRAYEPTGDALADLPEDMAAEQKARKTYDNILRLSDDPDVNNVIRFLREQNDTYLNFKS